MERIKKIEKPGLILCLRGKPIKNLKVLTKSLIEKSFGKLSCYGFSHNRNKTVFFLYFKREDVMRDIKQFYMVPKGSNSIDADTDSMNFTMIHIQDLLFRIEKANKQLGHPKVIFQIKKAISNKKAGVKVQKSKPKNNAATDDIIITELKKSLSEAFVHLKEAKKKGLAVKASLEQMRLLRDAKKVEPAKDATPLKEVKKVITRKGVFDITKSIQKELESPLKTPIIDSTVNWGDVEDLLEKKAEQKRILKKSWKSKLLHKGPKLYDISSKSNRKKAFEAKDDDGVSCSNTNENFSDEENRFHFLEEHKVLRKKQQHLKKNKVSC